MSEASGARRVPYLFLLVLCFYASSAVFGLVPALTAGPGMPPLSVILVAGTVLLYGTGSLLALGQRPEDSRVVVFAATGMLVTLSILLPRPDPAITPRWVLFALFASYGLVYMGSFAVFVHMAALIPRRNPFVERHPAFLRAHYLAAGLLALAVAAGNLFVIFPSIRWRLSVPAFRAANGVAYLYAGIAGLALLSHAAAREESAAGRRQALIVFFGLLPWTLNLAGWLLLPGRVYPLGLFRSVEPFVIVLVPASFLLAILGLRLFEIGAIVRKGLIYGLTTGLLAAAIALCVEGFGSWASRALGRPLGGWPSALLLILTGAALAPLLRRVTHAVDTLFFPEKIELRRLRQLVIPALAGYRSMDQTATQLVTWLRERLRLKHASLLMADEAIGFYRVRAQAGEFEDPRAREAVITRGDLTAWLGDARGKPRPADPARGGGAGIPRELKGMLSLLEANEAVPIGFERETVGLLVLGPSLSHAQFDGDDRRLLEDVARQASAMLENARLFDLATRDPLTGLPRRQVFEERLAQELERSRRAFEPFAVGLADIDGFKRVNDSCGHLMGDQVLRATAAALSRETRKSDLVARFGGEEFALLFPNAGRDGAVHLGETLCRRVEEHSLPGEAGEPLSVTISLGLHILRRQDTACSVEDLIRFADRALYEAKRLGKNRVAVYE